MTPYEIERRKLVVEYLNKYPDAPSRQLARMLNRDLPEYFSTIEYARGYIRQYRGTRGVRCRKNMSFTKYYKHDV
jgi:hypothetical protein